MWNKKKVKKMQTGSTSYWKVVELFLNKAEKK